MHVVRVDDVDVLNVTSPTKRLHLRQDSAATVAVAVAGCTLTDSSAAWRLVAAPSRAAVVLAARRVVGRRPPRLRHAALSDRPLGRRLAKIRDQPRQLLGSA